MSPATVPAATWIREADGIRLAYPGDWHDGAEGLHAAALPSRVDRTADSSRARRAGKIDVDVPSLPPHLPGMITLDRVDSGYVDDQKDRFADLKVIEKTDQSVPATKARRARVDAATLKNGDGVRRAGVHSRDASGDPRRPRRISSAPSARTSSTRPC